MRENFEIFWKKFRIDINAVDVIFRFVVFIFDDIFCRKEN